MAKVPVVWILIPLLANTGPAIVRPELFLKSSAPLPRFEAPRKVRLLPALFSVAVPPAVFTVKVPAVMTLPAPAIFPKLVNPN